MSNVIVDVSISLDGFLTGPNPSLEEPMGAGGMRLHEWVFGTRSWRESQGMEGGDEGGVDDEMAAEAIRGVGATIMGRKMFSGGSGPWGGEEKTDGWWGDEPPFHHPVFVLTHHPREPLVLGETTFTFVTDGPEAALEMAREVVGDQDIRIGGGADVVQQYVAAGAIDRLKLHIAPLLLGSGTRLFADDLSELTGLVPEKFVESPTGSMLLDYRIER